MNKNDIKKMRKGFMKNFMYQKTPENSDNNKEHLGSLQIKPTY